jgi:hypothetical protein
MRQFPKLPMLYTHNRSLNSYRLQISMNEKNENNFAIITRLRLNDLARS